jgi:mono/diheme cytochrome c family protein
MRPQKKKEWKISSTNKLKTLMEMKSGKPAFLLLVLLTWIGLPLLAQEWVVPDDQKSKISPYKFTADSIKKGEIIFSKTCHSCHGDPGKKNFAKITPEPGDPAGEKFQKQTDGEMFYRITTGKAPMPEFRNILAENDRWNVISYLRTFNPEYVQPNPDLKGGNAGRRVTLAMQYLSESGKIRVTAEELNADKVKVPAKGVEIALMVKRYFGNMKIGDPKTTNDKGVVLFDLPPALRGDRDGNVDFTAMVYDPSGKINDSQVRGTYFAGKPVNVPSLTETRAWWSVRSMAPVWVILVFSLSVIIVWGFIFYILISIGRIKNM